MNLIATTIGIISMILAIIGFFPLLGWLNWAALLLAFIGCVFGLFSRTNTGRNLNLLVLFIAIFRLMIGGGII